MHKLSIKIFSFIVTMLLLAGIKVSAQELNCNVSVMAPQVFSGNPQLFKSMETSIRDFMNNRHWTNDKFSPMERIQCNIVVTISKAENNSDFIGTLQITASRPVYGSNYTSATLNFMDNSFAFNYVEFQPMDYQEGTYSSELTSVLAFYANMILGFDYDSFSELGGSPYFQKAQTVVNAAQASKYSGWNAMEKNNKNRYNLASQINDDRLIPFRKAFYAYHRKGLDLMFQDNEKALNNVLSSLADIQAFYKDYPINIISPIFFEAKWRELIDLFSQAPSTQKNQARTILTSLDVTRANKYEDAFR